MARRVITAPGHDRNRSLGWIAVWFMETFTVRGPGDAQGEPVVYGDEFTGFFVDCYALDEDGRRLYDSAFFSRPKGCDKSGVGANLCLFEAFGPCRFDGWAVGGEEFEFLGQVYVYAKGEPMGRPIQSPFIRVMSTEEQQTGNVYDTIFYNLDDEASPLQALKAYGMDAGLTRILIPGGGEIRPSTSGSASKDGGLETFVCFDESHLYNTPELRRMYATVTRNLVKRQKGAGTWSFEPTTMYAAGEDSVAESTYHLADMIEAGKARRQKLLFDHRWGDLDEADVHDEEKLRAAIVEAYGDAIAWNSIEGVIDKIFDPRQTISESIRYFLNALTKKVNAWLSPQQWDAIGPKKDATLADLLTFSLDPGDTITLGFDGSESHDATALIACRVRDRLLVPLLIDSEPDGPEAANWMVDREAFDAAVAEAHEMYDVVGFFGDPPFWQDYLDKWFKEFGERYKVKASEKHPMYFWTKNDTSMSLALDRLRVAIVSGKVRQPGASTPFSKIMGLHFIHATKWKRRFATVIGKVTKGSPWKIDAAVAGTLAFECAAQYELKVKPESESWVPFRVR